MTQFPRPRPAARVSALESWIRSKAQQDGEDVARLRRSIGYVVVSAVLAQMKDNDGAPLFVVKGGVSMLLRFAGRARLSKDFDAAFRRDLDALEAVLSHAPRHAVGPFVVRAIGKPEPIGPTGVFRQTLDIRYGPSGQGFGKVLLEISRAEGQSGDPARLDLVDPWPDITAFGLPPAGPVPCMPVAYQIAQKLHACTEVLRHKDNERFHDLLDLQLLAELLDGEGWRATRLACEETFAARGTHAWPPVVVVYPQWREGYARVAAENGFPIAEIDDARARVEALIARIAAS